MARGNPQSLRDAVLKKAHGSESMFYSYMCPEVFCYPPMIPLRKRPGDFKFCFGAQIGYVIRGLQFVFEFIVKALF